MGKASKPEGAIQVQIWMEPDLVAWLDLEAVKRDRSRAYLVNEAVRRRMGTLESRRKSPSSPAVREGEATQGAASSRTKGEASD